MDAICSWKKNKNIIINYTISRWSFYWQLCTLDVYFQNCKFDPISQGWQEAVTFNFICSLLPVHQSSSPANPLHCSLNLISHEVFSKTRVNLASDRLGSLEHKSTFSLYGCSIWLAYADLHQYAEKGPTLPSNVNIPALQSATVCLPLAFNFLHKMIICHVLIWWLYNCFWMWPAISQLWFFS